MCKGLATPDYAARVTHGPILPSPIVIVTGNQVFSGNCTTYCHHTNSIALAVGVINLPLHKLSNLLGHTSPNKIGWKIILPVSLPLLPFLQEKLCCSCPQKGWKHYLDCSISHLHCIFLLFPQIPQTQTTSRSRGGKLY